MFRFVSGSCIMVNSSNTPFSPCRRPDLSGDISIAKPDWETYCHKVADMIIQEQSPQRVMDVRVKLYELLSHCIPPTVILKVRKDNLHQNPPPYRLLPFLHFTV